MSMNEALRPLRGIVDWLTNGGDEEQAPPVAATPLDQAEYLIYLAKTPGVIDKTSATWTGVASRAAKELIIAQARLETADGDRAAQLRARCATLRDVLAFGEDREVKPIEDEAPFIP